MSPTQTSGRDSFGWRLRCPFRYPPTRGRRRGQLWHRRRRQQPKASSKIKDKASGAEEAAGETESAAKARARQGRAGASRRKAAKPAAAKAAKRKPATGKPPVSNVEAIKAVAIKAAAKGAAPAAGCRPTRTPRDHRLARCSTFRMPPSAR